MSKRDRGDRGVMKPTRTILERARAQWLLAQGRKCCTKCGAEKPLDEFHLNSKRRSGRTEHCKSCVNPGRMPPARRFEKYVDRFCPALPHMAAGGLGSCWIWQGSRNQRDYGQLHVSGRPRLASRVAYELFVGPIGDKDVCHHCDNPPCCNPAHLFLGTHLQNMRDMHAKGRARFGGKRRPPRMNWETAVAVRFAVALGADVKPLAVALGMSEPAIRGVLNYRTWRSVA